MIDSGKKSLMVTLGIVFLILVIGIIYILGNKKTNLNPPERSAYVPKQAEWIGGSDGGNWYFITNVLSNNRFKIKIYNDGNGALEIDATFILNPDCHIKNIDSVTLIKSIDGYDGEKILLNLPGEGKRCSLIISKEGIN